MSNIYRITKAIYSQMAEQLALRVENDDFYSGTIGISDGDRVHYLELSIVLYRDRASGEVIDIEAIWWESYTIDERCDSTPQINDFDFSLFKRALL